MKNMKKFFSLVLAIVMVMALAAPVMAAEEHSHTITINKTTPGLEYKAYQIFAGDVTEVNGKDILTNVKWGSGVDTTKKVDWGTTEAPKVLTLLEALQDSTVNTHAYSDVANELAHALNAKKNKGDNNPLTPEEEAAAVVEALSTLVDDGAAIKQIARIFGAYLKTAAATSTEEKDADGKTTHYEIEGLADGYYMVDQTKVAQNETATEYLLELIKNVTITPKDGVVTVDKGINDGTGTLKDATSADIGDVIDFEIIAELPDNYAEFETFYFAFKDTMSKGLTLDADSIKVELINEESHPDIRDEFYTVTGTTPDATTGITTFTVAFADLKQLTASPEYTVNANTKIKLSYSATLNSDADVTSTGNPNEVVVLYDNDPYTEEDPSVTPPSIVKVYTFALEVVKTDGDSNKPLEGVQFVLVRERQGHEQYAVVENGKLKGWTNWLTEADLIDYVDNTLKIVDDATTEVNERDAKINALKVAPGVATQLTTNAEGKILVEGLDVGIYTLRETKALEGYNMIGDVDFTIAATYNGTELNTHTINVYGKTVNGNNGKFNIGVVNNPGKELPTTGGMGTTLFYVFGSIMVVGAAVLLITKKRMAA